MSPEQSRSTDPLDYQMLAQPVAAMSKDFADGFVIAPHCHARDQLLYAVSGTMRITTAGDAWIVPPDRAVYIPGGVVHSVSMRGPVAMRTLYVARPALSELPGKPGVMTVSALLRALVLALLEEPVTYQPGSRADRIAALILDEIARAEPLALALPMPRDPRLMRLCTALVGQPDLGTTFDQWADQVGASRRTLARLFRDECGMTFTAWRQRVRLHAALEALTRGSRVGDAARANGYATSSAFSAAFRQAFGVSPKSVAAVRAAPRQRQSERAAKQRRLRANPSSP